MTKRSKNFILSLVALLLLGALLFVSVVLRGGRLGQRPASGQGAGAFQSSSERAAQPGQTVPPAPETALPPEEGELPLVRITELMAKNRSVLRAPDGSFPDWIELENRDEQAVDLAGWRLSDRESGGWSLPALTLQPGERLLVYADGTGRQENGALYADFSLSGEETLYLLSPGGRTVDTLPCSAAANHAVARGEGEEIFETKNATPGYPNTNEGYEAFSRTLSAAGPLVIHEVMVSNFSYLKQGDAGYTDWVELKNISSAALELSDYYLSDDNGDLRLWQLPQQSLAPGETVLIFCSGDEANSSRGNTHSSFSLDAAEEDLFLTDRSGALLDYVYLRNIPVDGSMGRRDGESGWFYFLAPSPGQSNSGGYRRVSEKPVSLQADGVFDGVESVQVELSAPGQIYYSLGGELPSAASTPYTGPITLTETGILRAVAVEEGAAPSRVLTLSYILNEHHELPVLSLVTDDLARFRTIYYRGIKYTKVPSSLSFYEDGGSFTIACGVSMKGWTSLELPKRSMGVSFGGYGDGDLRYDPFGQGIDRYASLAIRAGQDYPFSVIRNELCQDLCAEAGDSVLTQASRWCALYINGEYWGLYVLKEDFSRQYYASHAGVSKGSVTMVKSPVTENSDLLEDIFRFSANNDMSRAENYETFCERFDVDSLIDWLILEAWCANSDINGNMRYFRSQEGDGKWRIAFYDLDWTFRTPGNTFDNVINPTRIVQISPTVNALLKNEQFRLRLARRCVELSRGVLSNEHVLARIDEMQAMLEPEMERERERWGGSVSGWYTHLDMLRGYITNNKLDQMLVSKLLSFLHLTQEQRNQVLG